MLVSGSVTIIFQCFVKLPLKSLDELPSGSRGYTDIGCRMVGSELPSPFIANKKYSKNHSYC